MAIYKLGDICSYIEGYTNPIVDDSSNFDTSGHLGWLKVADLIHGKYISKTTTYLSTKAIHSIRKKEQIFKKGTIVWSKSGSIGITSILAIDVAANRGILNILPNENVLNKYLFYFLIKNRSFYESKGAGGVLKHFYGPQLMSEMVNAPPLNIQQQIIDIIEPKEKLFLSHSNCVRIDTIDNVKKDMQNLIDIIEPVEKLENFCIKLQERLQIFENALYEKNYIKSVKNTLCPRGDFISESIQKVSPSVLVPKGIGYGGFTQKNGKIPELLKAVKKYEFAVGLISKDLPAGLNYTNSTFGVSVAYKVFKSNDECFAKLWICWMDLKKNWNKYVIPTARQGQGFDTKQFLNDGAVFPQGEEWEKINDKILIVYKMKDEIDIIIDKIKLIKKNLIYSLIK